MPTDMNALIRRAAGRTEPEPEPTDPDPRATWGKGDGGATGGDHDPRSGSQQMTDLIRARADWRRFVARERG